MAADSSRTTHGAAAAVDACRYMAALIVGALTGASKDELLSPLYALWSAAGMIARSAARWRKWLPGRALPAPMLLSWSRPLR